jgi:hypothetical protein
MPNRFWVAGGTGNYNSTTNWSASSGGASGASVPTNVDDVFINASSGSGNVILNTGGNTRNLDLTGFIGTITFINGLTVNGTSINFGTGGYTVSGASGLALQTSMSITSNGTTYTGNVSFSGGVIYTLVGNMSVSGNVTFSSTGTQTLNGNVLSIGGNLTHSNTSVVTGTTSFVLNGTGTWSHTNTGVIRNNFTINTAGTITIGTNVRYNTGILTYTAGTVVTAGSTLNIAAATTLNTNGIAWNNISTASSLTITLGSNLTLTGTLTVGVFGVATLSFVLGGFNIISSSANLSVANSNTFTVPQNLTFVNVTVDSGVTLNGNQITATGNLTHIGSVLVAGTTSIILGGTGTWNHISSGAIRNNIIINTAGTITLGTNIYYSTGTITYITGTVVTAGSTLNINENGSNTTLNTNGIIWNNIRTINSITLTLGSNLTLIGTLTLSTLLNVTLGGNSLISTNANLFVDNGTFNLPANQTFKSLSTGNLTAAINSNTLTLTENITLGAPTTGTANIVYGGTGTWTAGTAAHIINNNFTINTAGTLTISGIVYKTLNTITYTAGTVASAGGTLVIGGSTTCNIAGVTWNKLIVGGPITLTSNINAVTFGTTGNNTITFTLGGNTLNFTHLELGHTAAVTLPFAWTCQNIDFAIPSSGLINGFSITINGNIVQSGNGVLTGNTSFIYAGTGTWSRTGTTYFSNSFTINTAGTLTFSGGSIGGGIFTYTAGTVNVQTGSILTIRVAGTTMNHGAIVWYDVILGSSLGVGSVGTLILNNKLTCSNSLILGTSSTVFSGTDGTFDTYDLYFGSQSSSQTTRLVATKTYTVRRLVQCTQAPSTFPLTLNSTVVGTRAIFTVLKGSTIDIGFLNVTDINSSLGKKLYSYRGVISNSLNWAQLPTDVKPATSIFVN